MVSIHPYVFQVRAHLLAKAERDRAGGVSDEPIEVMEGDEASSGTAGFLGTSPVVTEEEEVASTMMEA